VTTARIVEIVIGVACLATLVVASVLKVQLDDLVRTLLAGAVGTVVPLPSTILKKGDG
jgi:integral membrane sensor domain MASE1